MGRHDVALVTRLTGADLTRQGRHRNARVVATAEVRARTLVERRLHTTVSCADSSRGRSVANQWMHHDVRAS